MTVHITLRTLCGCSREMTWDGIPPLVLSVPLRHRMSFEDWTHRPLEQPDPNPHVRKFRMSDQNGKFMLYYDEVQS